MAEEDGQERTEDPTAKRRSKAQEKGQAPRSRDLNTMLLLLVVSGSLYVAGNKVSNGMQEIFVASFTQHREALLDPTTMLSVFMAAIQHALITIAPVLLLTAIAALVAPVINGSWVFSWTALGFNWSRMDPLAGLGRLFGMHGWLEMLKALLKFSLLIAVAYFVIDAQLEQMIALVNLPIHSGIAESGALLGKDLLIFSAVTMLIAAADVPYQWWSHTRKLKMSRQEVKDEMRETEGKPEVKARIRRVQQEIARRRMMQAVPKADVIVTNPTHYAVALRYQAAEMRAPKVVAKGVDEVAMNIRTVGRQHRVPTVTAPALARSLYFNSRLDQEIPDGLYVAVARVLAYVFQLKQSGTLNAEGLEDLPIPPELRRDA